MMKIRLMELEKHRNETTFRPFLMRQDTFRDFGIMFVREEAKDYDITFVGQASIADKQMSLMNSIEHGIKFLDKVDGPYVIIDGQDATTLIGTIDVFRASDASLFLKNSYLKDPLLYKNHYVLGRYYWGEDPDKFYHVPDIEKLWPTMKLSGTNWLATMMNVQFDKQNFPPKTYNVSAMFQYPMHKQVFEHGQLQSSHYDNHRKKLIDKLQNMPSIQMLKDGQRLSQQEYYSRMSRCKIVIAPFGYGEMAPRDIEAVMLGSILIKPSMEHVGSYPNIYEPNATYISCRHDYSDIEEKIEYALEDFEYKRDLLFNNMKRLYTHQYLNPDVMVSYVKELMDTI